MRLKSAILTITTLLFSSITYGDLDIECETWEEDINDDFKLVTAKDGGKASISGNIIDQSGPVGNINRYNLNLSVQNSKSFFNLKTLRFGSSPADTSNKAILKHLKSHVAPFNSEESDLNLKEKLLAFYDLSALETTYKENDGIKGYWHDKNQLWFSFNTTKRASADTLDFNCNMTAKLNFSSTGKEKNEDTGELEDVYFYQGLATTTCVDARTYNAKSIFARIYCQSPTPKAFSTTGK